MYQCKCPVSSSRLSIDCPGLLTMLKLRCGFTVEDTAVIHLLGTLILGTVVHKNFELGLGKRAQLCIVS